MLLGRRVPAWVPILLTVMFGSAAVTAALAAPYAEVNVGVSQTVVIDSISWVAGSTTFDVYDSISVGQGQHAKVIVMGQGNDYGFLKIRLRNLAGSENLVKVYAEDVSPELKVKFTKASDPTGSQGLFDESYAKISANDAADVYMYLLVKPGTPQKDLSFTVVVEVLGG